MMSSKFVTLSSRAAFFALTGITLQQNALAAGSLVANFNVAGSVPSIPSWYDDGVLINTPTNNPNTTILFTFGKGTNPLPDSSGNFQTDTRFEAVTNPNSVLTIKTFTVTIPSGCTIGGAADIDIGDTTSVDSSMSINIGGTKFIGSNTDISAQETKFLYTTANASPGASTGAQVFLALALGSFYPSSSNSGNIVCSSAGNFTLTF